MVYYDLISLLYFVIKYMLLSLLIYILYLVYWLIYCPYRNRQYFKKYLNVKMTDRFYPMMGDVALWFDNAKNGFGAFHHYIQEAADYPKVDFRYTQIGER